MRHFLWSMKEYLLAITIVEMGGPGGVNKLKSL
ncbi:hypothetical protein SAMN05421813_1571, partial [Daejeonella rubra]